jgi:hypothetical protein
LSTNSRLNSGNKGHGKRKKKDIEKEIDEEEMITRAKINTGKPKTSNDAVQYQ